MEFSFDIPKWLHLFLDQPIYIVFAASFGVILLIIVFVSLFALIGKYCFKRFFDKLIVVFTTSLVATLITGFITMMIFLFAEVSPIKMILIWASMSAVYLIFAIINVSQLNKFLSETDVAKVKK